MTTNDVWAYWRAALKGEAAPPVLNQPQIGYWMQRIGRERIAVSLYPHPKRPGELLCKLLRSGGEMTNGVAIEIWPGCCRSPIEYATWTHLYQHKRWPDEPLPLPDAPADLEDIPAFTEGMPAADAAPEDVGGGGEPATEGRNGSRGSEDVAPADRSPPPIGHNNPPTSLTEGADDPIFADIAQRGAHFASQIEAATKITDKVSADLAANLINTFKGLEKEADAARRAEKKPFDEAAKAVQAKWTPLIDRLGTVVAPLQRAITAYLKAENAKRNAEAAAAIAAGAAPAEAAKPKAKAGSAGSRAVSLRTVKFAVVDDWNALMVSLHDNPTIRAEAQRLADAAARSGVSLPGCRIDTRQEAV